MELKRLEVEEGFLHGLSLEFVPGLNVLIGPRGAGKTSIIELIRYCLGAGAYSPASARSAEDHALSILRGGRCTLTVELDGEVLELSRSEDDPPPLEGEPQRLPIVLSQNEIEKVGLDSRGRMRLIDDFREQVAGSDDTALESGRVLTEVASITQELNSTIEIAAQLEEEVLAAEPIVEQLEEAEAEQEKTLEKYSELEPQRLELEALDEHSVSLQDRRDLIKEAVDALEEWSDEIRALRSESSSLLPDSGDIGPKDDPLTKTRTVLGGIADRLAAAEEEGRSELTRLRKEGEKATSAYRAGREKGRALRARLDEAQAGSGEISRRISDLKERRGAAAVAEKRLKRVEAELTTGQTKRKKLLAKVASIRRRQFKTRKAIAAMLSKKLGPQVDVSVVNYGALDNYAEAIKAALQGSRLRYKQLAPKLAGCMTPVELVEAVEHGQAKTIATAAKIPMERASKVVEAIRTSGTSEILRAQVEDSINIALLDGSDYKLTPKMSTGQRCTTILPILLSHLDRTVVIDQPEDHLDNAYVADTVVRTLREAPEGSQLIVTTHNANIPVLGEADRVTLLESDGQRGFVKTSDVLDAPKTVSAITRVMEGGKEAFRQRSRFYDEHS